MKFGKIRVEFKFKAMFTCSRCGALQEGTMARIVVYSAKEAEEFLKAPPLRMQDMPMQWTHRHNEDGEQEYVCPRCMREVIYK